jgi:hypothetical protein
MAPGVSTVPGVSEYVRDHELLAVGTVAGVIVAAVALAQLRRPAAGAATAGPGIPTIADLSSAFGAGAGAAASGFQPGVDLANAGLSAGVGLGQAGLDTGATLATAALQSEADALAAALGLAAQAAAGNASGSGVAGSGGGVVPGGQGTGDGVPSGSTPAPTPAPSGSGLVTGVTLRFSGPTTVYARTTAGYIGAHKTFGSAGLTVGANELLVPHDPAHQTGGSFWRMTSGAAAGWLVSTSNPAVSVSGGHA